MNKKYEYTSRWKLNFTDISSLGLEGWQLCAISPNNDFFFKKEIKESKLTPPDMYKDIEVPKGEIPW